MLSEKQKRAVVGCSTRHEPAPHVAVPYALRTTDSIFLRNLVCARSLLIAGQSIRFPAVLSFFASMSRSGRGCRCGGRGVKSAGSRKRVWVVATGQRFATTKDRFGIATRATRTRSGRGGRGSGSSSGWSRTHGGIVRSASNVLRCSMRDRGMQAINAVNDQIRRRQRRPSHMTMTSRRLPTQGSTCRGPLSVAKPWSRDVVVARPMSPQGYKRATPWRATS